VILLPEQDALSTTTLGGHTSATGSAGFFSYSRFNIDQREIASQIVFFGYRFISFHFVCLV
jgi:hypothetical protein